MSEKHIIVKIIISKSKVLNNRTLINKWFSDDNSNSKVSGLLAMPQGPGFDIHYPGFQPNVSNGHVQFYTDLSPHS